MNNNGAEWERPSRDLRADSVWFIDGADKRRRGQKRFSKVERELSSFIVSVKALWKNGAIHCVGSTENSGINISSEVT